MDLDTVSELGRQALYITVLVSMPAMVTGMVIGLIISVLQSITSVQEQTLSFVPKILATLVVTIAALPWMLALVMEYTEQLFLSIPMRF
ncbi:flagellar biosynthesis protein FliQ [bacterium]|jgi:flagellar biosynthesis protein FliQ|nr:flagellar biosynthesis protein FliQ [bacterium]